MEDSGGAAPPLPEDTLQPAQSTSWLVVLVLLVVVGGALGIMAYVATRGTNQSDFFLESVNSEYELELPETEINAYFDLRESLQAKYAPDTLDEDPALAKSPWVQKVPEEQRQNLQRVLMQRLVAVIGRLDQVQRDKPGNMKLWRGKLISEHYWNSLCNAEKMVGEEIDSCVSEANELQPGWKDHIFQQAVQVWQMERQREREKKVLKKATVSEKKQKVKDAKQVDVDARMVEEAKVRDEKKAAKAMEQLLKEEELEAKKSKAASTGKRASTAAKKKSK